MNSINLKKTILSTILFLLISTCAIGQNKSNTVTDLALGLASEELFINLHACIKEAEQEGKYDACETTKNYYINIKHHMNNKDLSEMDAGRKIRIEKRLAIIEALQIRN